MFNRPQILFSGNRLQSAAVSARAARLEAAGFLVSPLLTPGPVAQAAALVVCFPTPLFFSAIAQAVRFSVPVYVFTPVTPPLPADLPGYLWVSGLFFGEPCFFLAKRPSLF